jgi:hypothetical protein
MQINNVWFDSINEIIVTSYTKESGQLGLIYLDDLYNGKTKPSILKLVINNENNYEEKGTLKNIFGGGMTTRKNSFFANSDSERVDLSVTSMIETRSDYNNHKIFLTNL